MRTLSRDQARRATLHAQGFGSRPAAVNRGHLRRLMRRLNLLQLDSIPVIIRTQYLPAYSRLGAYDPALLDDLAYRRDEWFEQFVHEASLLPVEDEPYLRFLQRRAERGETWGGLPRLARSEPEYVASVLAQVRDVGPLSAAELDSPRPRKGDWWAGRSIGALALDWLYRIGAVGIRRVGNFEKQYDLYDRIVPEAIRSVPTPDEDDAMKHLLVLAAEAFGVGTASCLIDYHRLPKRPSRPLVAELAEDGRLIECRVEGNDKPVFMHPDAVVPRSIDARAFVSPFDPVVWNRPRGEWLFDFEYRIEIYVPKAKRRYGYYVLPFLLGDEIVARCDLKTDRDAGVLRVLSAHPEPGVDVGEIAPAMAAELDVLARMVGVDEVSVDARSRLATGIRAHRG